jgi:hypothetical protein
VKKKVDDGIAQAVQVPVVFDRSSFQEKVTEKIKATFMDLLPKEQFANLVESEIKRFIERDLRGLVQEVLQEKYRKLVKSELNSPKYQAEWKKGKEQTPEVVKQICVELMPVLIEEMFKEQVKGVVNQVRSQQGLPYSY